ncbi:MAG: NAD(P)-dependent oxidoreductase [Synergistaceae bacterium]|nr:NAD(P)-dependent oxidoreductase [Synergistaceae bacterium]
MMSFSFEAVRSISIDILTDTGLYAGTVVGTFRTRTPSCFSIENISIEPEYLSDTLMRQAVYELIDAAVHDGAESFSWYYPEPDGADYTYENADPRVQIMRSVLAFMPELKMRRILHSRDYRIDLKALPERMWHRYHFSEEWLAEGGIKFVPLSGMPEYAGQIRRLCDEDADAFMLSPLSSREYDPETSMLALCGGEVIGWTVCRKVDEETVDFMKYYVAEKFRTFRRGGAVLIAVAIRRIEAKYSAVKLHIREDARSVRRFYAYYFKEAFTAGRRYFMIELGTRNQAESEGVELTREQA